MNRAHADRKGSPRTRAGVLVACTLGNFLGMTPVVVVVLSLFLIPISTEFGWPRARVTGVVALLSVIGFVVVPVAGRLADRYGTRRVILSGQVAFALSLSLLAFANGSTLQFYLIFAVIGVAGSFPVQPLFSKIIAEWFDDNRALCLAISGGVGAAVGSTVMPVIAGILLTHFGWRSAYFGLGLIVLAVGVPTLFALLKDPMPHGTSASATSAPPLGATSRQAFATRTFWIILIALGLGASFLTAVFTHIVPLLTDRGFSLATATAVLSVAGVTCAGWQIVVGITLDRASTPRILFPMYLAAAGGVLLIQLGQSVPAMLAGGVFIGIGLGSEYGALSYLLSRYFGLRAYGTITGAIFGFIILSTGIIPFFFDMAYDSFGSYSRALQTTVVAILVSACMVLLLPPYRVDLAARART